MKKTWILGLLMVAGLSTLPLGAKQPASDANHLSVSVQGKVNAKADLAIVFMTVRSTAPLAGDPLALSPNALHRPVVQDILLPTIAYIADPSELAYLRQAQVLYEAFERPQPVFSPRAAFTLVDHRTQRLLEKYRLSVEDVWLGEEHLSGKIAALVLAEGWSERFA